MLIIVGRSETFGRGGGGGFRSTHITALLVIIDDYFPCRSWVEELEQFSDFSSGSVVDSGGARTIQNASGLRFTVAEPEHPRTGIVPDGEVACSLNEIESWAMSLR